MTSSTTRYFVRQMQHHVTGPYRLDQLRKLIGQGKLRPDMEFSEDGKEWAYGLELTNLFSSEWRSRKIASWYMPTKWAKHAGRLLSLAGDESRLSHSTA